MMHGERLSHVPCSLHSLIYSPLSCFYQQHDQRLAHYMVRYHIGYHNFLALIMASHRTFIRYNSLIGTVSIISCFGRQ